jgi:dihydroneopterin aldolase
MVGQLELQGIQVPCIIGDRPDERLREGLLRVDLTLTFDFAPVAQNDDVTATVDYVALTERVRHVLQTGKYQMIERAAVEVCRACLEDRRVLEARVRVEKSGAIPHLQAASATVTLKQA